MFLALKELSSQHALCFADHARVLCGTVWPEPLHRGKGSHWRFSHTGQPGGHPWKHRLSQGRRGLPHELTGFQRKCSPGFCTFRFVLFVLIVVENPLYCWMIWGWIEVKSLPLWACSSVQADEPIADYAAMDDVYQGEGGFCCSSRTINLRINLKNNAIVV